MCRSILVTVIAIVFAAIAILTYVHPFNSGGNGSGTSTYTLNTGKHRQPPAQQPLWTTSEHYMYKYAVEFRRTANTRRHSDKDNDTAIRHEGRVDYWLKA